MFVSYFPPCIRHHMHMRLQIKALGYRHLFGISLLENRSDTTNGQFNRFIFHAECLREPRSPLIRLIYAAALHIPKSNKQNTFATGSPIVLAVSSRSVYSLISSRFRNPALQHKDNLNEHK